MGGWSVSGTLGGAAGCIGTGYILISFVLAIGLISVDYFSGGSNLWNVTVRLRRWICVSVLTGGSMMPSYLVNSAVVRSFATTIII